MIQQDIHGKYCSKHIMIQQDIHMTNTAENTL